MSRDYQAIHLSLYRNMSFETIGNLSSGGHCAAVMAMSRAEQHMVWRVLKYMLGPPIPTEVKEALSHSLPIPAWIVAFAYLGG